jgi:hypothetical protein
LHVFFAHQSVFSEMGLCTKLPDINVKELEERLVPKVAVVDMEKGPGTGDRTHAQGTMSLDPPLDPSLVPCLTGQVLHGPLPDPWFPGPRDHRDPADSQCHHNPLCNISLNVQNSAHPGHIQMMLK